MDLNSGAILFVGEGKGADALNPFWRRLKSSRAKIDAVAMDMSAAYVFAVTEHLPEATIDHGSKDRALRSLHRLGGMPGSIRQAL